MLNTWGQLLVMAMFLTGLALWKMNILLAIVSSVGWTAFLFYHLSNQPTGITAGDTADTYIIWAVGIIIIAIPLITILRGRRRITAGNFGSMEGDGIESETNDRPTLSGMSTAEYQAYIRSKLRRRGQ